MYPEETDALDIGSLEHDINIDFEEKSTHEEGATSEIYQRPDKPYFQVPPELHSQVVTAQLVQRIFAPTS